MKGGEENPGGVRLSRRVVLKWFAAASVAVPFPGWLGRAADGAGAVPPALAAKGYGTDPNVADYYKPGDFWPLTLTREERSTMAALADVILPADQFGPSASAVRVPEFMDEWVSAPYPQQRKDRELVLAGLKWVEGESARRFQRTFAALDDVSKGAICDVMAAAPGARAELREVSRFFLRFRSLAASAYYGTEEGWKAIGYAGNVPLTRFDGPPQEVLDRLNL